MVMVGPKGPENGLVNVCHQMPTTKMPEFAMESGQESIKPVKVLMCLLLMSSIMFALWELYNN